MLSLTVFALIYLIRLAPANEYHNNGLIFDVTGPLNDIMHRKTTEKDLIKNLHAMFSFNGDDFTNRTLYYAADGKTIAEMEEQTLECHKILKNTVGITSGENILISWTVNITKLNMLEFPSHIKTETTLEPIIIIINLPDGTECNDQLRETFWFKLFGRFVGNVGFSGVSFSESLIECSFIRHLLVDPKIVVVNFKFGFTVGIQESFGLFQMRFQFLSDSITAISRKSRIGDSRPKIVYFPTPDCVGDNNHRQLLVNYGSIWTSSNDTDGEIIVQGYNATDEPKKLSITPSIATLTAKDLPNSFSWLDLLFATGFKRQQSLILNDFQWRLFIRGIERLNQNPNIPPSLHLPLDLILDYSGYMPFSSNLTARTWKEEETLMNKSLQLGVNTTGAKLSTIVFPLQKKICSPFENCEYNIPPKILEFAKKMAASNVVIGCTIWLGEFQGPDFAADVNACNEINATMYILRKIIVFYGHQDVWSYSFHYESRVRESLEKVNDIRKYILNKQPLAQVHLELKLEVERNSTINPFQNLNPLFCDEFVNRRNIYLEAMINWANLENIPIILKLDNKVEHEVNIYHVWFSLLRQLNNPYLEWSFQDWEDKIENEFPLNNATLETHPSFLMRNYLKSNYNWKMDTCIDWKEGNYILKDDYFHNNYVGATFHTDMSTSHASSLEEYRIKLEFIFHRFQLAEFVVSTDFPKLVSGISTAVNVSDLRTTEVLVCYVPSKENRHSELTNFQYFLASVTGMTLYESKTLSGIHVELGITEKLEEKLTSIIINGYSVLTMIKETKQSNLNAGFLTSVKMCEEILKNSVLPEGNLIAELLREANYIVCEDERGYIFENGTRSHWEPILDSHLFIKRLANVLFPHLEVYFRVELQIEINENRTVLTKYMSLVDLFKTFGTAYDISYFIVEAFDSKSAEKKSGWWGIQNFSDLANPNSYVEKLLVYNDQIMWYPKATPSFSAIPQNSRLIAIISFASFAVILVLIAMVFAVIVRYKKLQQILSDEEVQEFLNGKVHLDTGNEETGNLDHMKFNPLHNLELSDIFIDTTKILGQGTFGTVYKGTVKEDVAAIKRPNCATSKQTFMSVLAEVKVLSYIGSHPNVVEFLGAYTKEIHNGILHIATEFCSNGSLESFLRKKTNVISDQEANTYDIDEFTLHQLDLSRFSLEIAKGMEYIGTKNIVHGDLASRNVLLNENLVCKIGDFGLSRKLYEYQKYVKTSQEPLPWKWMAYESLTKMEFTPKSDVWSYGVTLWEIYSLGKIPYAGLNWSVTFSEELLNGLRPTIPQFSVPEIYNKMCECWNLDVNERPSFAELFTFFQGLSDDSYSIL